MTTSTSTSTPNQAADRRRPAWELVGEVAGEYVAELQRGYRADHSNAVARLAQLRRGAGKLPEDVPELWGVTGAEQLYLQQPLTETEAARAENALFLAVTLYALHQQSRSQQDMHRTGVDLGAAVRQLMYETAGDRIDEPIRRRFVRVGNATTLDTLAYRLREIVTLLRRESIPLDYARLARHLYEVQLPGGLARVRQQWGRGFHAHWPRPAATATTEPSSTTPATDRTSGEPITQD